MAKIEAAIPATLSDLQTNNWAQAAEGIMTTDTRPKVAWRQGEFGGERVVITGGTKGGGMSRPTVATRRGYGGTDLAVEGVLLQQGWVRGGGQG